MEKKMLAAKSSPRIPSRTIAAKVKNSSVA
jgi:hypothetical protein